MSKSSYSFFNKVSFCEKCFLKSLKNEAAFENKYCLTFNKKIQGSFLLYRISELSEKLKPRVPGFTPHLVRFRDRYDYEGEIFNIYDLACGVCSAEVPQKKKEIIEYGDLPWGTNTIIQNKWAEFLRQRIIT